MRFLAALTLLWLAGASNVSATDCYETPVTEFTPSGLAGCVQYGIGTASTWGGPGAARNDCVYPWTDCQTVSVRSLDTGMVIIVTPVMFGDLYQRVGPNGETTRIIDLDPSMIAALHLDPSDGLFRVEVWPAGTMPDSAYRAD